MSIQVCATGLVAYLSQKLGVTFYLLGVLLCLMVLPSTASADSGPKPAVTITVVNALAVVSGMICDGAKSSCAAKIAVSVEAGIMGYFMYQQGQEFYGGDGIVAKGIEKTIRNVGRLGRDGMRETNEEIIRMMTGC